MKKKLVIVAVMAINLSTFGQLKIGANKYVGIGALTGDPLSFVSVGDNGSSTQFFRINSLFTADYTSGLLVYQNNTPYHRFAIRGITYSGTSYAFGIHGYSYNSTVNSSGRAYGVYGYAGNATAGYNYGIYGYIAGSNNGAGVFGTTSGDTYIDGKYAGYFYGNVKISGNAYINGSTLVTSDITAKKEIKELSKDNISKLVQLNGIKYKLKTPAELNLKTNKNDTVSKAEVLTETEQKLYNKERIGLSAQELQKLYPDLVETDNSGLLAVDYTGLIPVLIEAIKEQQTEIELLKKELKLANSGQ